MTEHYLHLIIFITPFFSFLFFFADSKPVNRFPGDISSLNVSIVFVAFFFAYMNAMTASMASKSHKNKKRIRS